MPGDPGDEVRSSWTSEIEKVSRCIDMPKMKTNSITGFHVHIGCQGGEFSLEEVQRIAGYVIVFEGKTDFINGHSLNRNI